MAHEIGEDNGVIKLDNGEELYSPTDFNTSRRLIFEGAKSALEKSFGYDNGTYRVGLDNLEYDRDDDFTIAEERDALLNNRMLAKRLRGNVSLYKNGDKIEEKKVTLMNVPYLTNRGTFIHGGNDYGRISQFRLLPGAYARLKASGDLETQINPRTGTGRSMKLEFDPVSAGYSLHVGGRKIHAYSLFRELGKSDADLRAMWGDDVLKANATKMDARALTSAYEVFVKDRDRKQGATSQDMRTAVLAALDQAQLNREVVERTLPSLLGGQIKTAYDQSIQDSAEEIASTEFAPDDHVLIECIKLAAEQEYDKDEFSPDLNADDMQPAHEAIYAKVRPRLASMKAWPTSWMGENQLGWVDWYIDYTNGKRTADDNRQKARWQKMKARHGALFVRNPTPKAAFMLRYWAIDPLKLLEDKPAAQAKLRREMEEYEAEMQEKFDNRKNKWHSHAH